MAIENIGQDGCVFTGEHIGAFALLALKGALKLEVLGMKRRGESAFAQVKRLYGFKGNKASVLSQFENRLREDGILKPA